MKHLIHYLILAFAMPFTCQAVETGTVFAPGTIWALTAQIDYPPFSSFDIELTLGEYTTVYGKNCMPLTYTHFNDGNVTLTEERGYVHADGDKVWYHSTSDEQEWMLMYDFGLQAGETATVVQSASSNPSHCIAVEVKCIELGVDEQFEPGAGLAMDMPDYSDDDDPTQGFWLNGIGSVRGVDENAGFDLVGGGGRILKYVALADGTIVCKNKNYNTDGIATVSARENAPDGYYNLQGMPAAKPAPGGIYVRVTNGTAEKIAVK